MKKRPERKDAASKLEEMTADDTKLFIKLNHRDVTFERTGEGASARYILTWGLEGEKQPAGKEGFIAILFTTNLAVERALNHKPQAAAKKHGKLETPDLFDRTKGAILIREEIKVLIDEILRANERKLLAAYRRLS